MAGARNCQVSIRRGLLLWEDKKMRKVFVEVKVALVINADEGVDISEVLAEMECSFPFDTGADIESTEILDSNITDSK
jgi:hypothetical protein